jgi:hypothetical protein
MILSGDDRFVQDATIGGMRAAANDLLDRFLDVSWLAWGEPAGLMPATRQRARDEAASAERRRVAAMEQRRLEERRREEERKRREAEKKVAGGSSRPSRKVVGRKASKASSVGEDVSMSDSESAGTGENVRLPKSEVAKREARVAWTEIKAGRTPTGYTLVSRRPLAELVNAK